MWIVNWEKAHQNETDMTKEEEGGCEAQKLNFIYV